MSSSLAIASVTAALSALLRQATPNVTTLPLSSARGTGAAGDQLNVCLYQVGIDAALRNTPPPQYPGVSGSANNLLLPLPLTLSYLVTAFVDDSPNSEIDSQILLCEAMRILHDHPLLGASEIRAASQGFPRLRRSDAHQQVERIRITPQPLSDEQISRLWTAFQTGHRLSVAYQVGAVIIDSARKGGSALPVLRRGADDTGAAAATLTGVPDLEELNLPFRQSSALPGDTITLRGKNLGAITAVRLLRPSGDRKPDDPQNFAIPEPGSSPDELRVKLTPTLAPRAGIYSVAAAHESEIGGEAHQLFTSALPFTLAAKIKTVAPFGGSIPPPPATPPPLPVAKRDASGSVRLAVSFEPPVSFSVTKEFAQPVRLLFGRREIAPEPTHLVGGVEKPLPAGEHDTLLFVLTKVPDADLRDHLLRLRVDGVDAAAAELKKDAQGRERLEFSDAQKVRITA